MQSSAAGEAQLFYDTGSGYSESSSVTSSIAARTDFTYHLFRLPNDKILQFRFDPLSSAGRFVIRQIEVVNGLGTPIHSISTYQVKPAHQIREYKLLNQDLQIVTEDPADDPQLIINLQKPLSLNARTLLLTPSFLVFSLIFCILLFLLFIESLWSWRNLKVVYYRFLQPIITVIRTKINKDRRFVCLFFILLFLFHVFRLDADPSPLQRFGAMPDEGYWLHNARMFLISGNFMLFPDDSNVSFIGAPLFTFLEVPILKIFGFSFFSARLLCVAAMLGICVEAYLMFRGEFGRFESLLAPFLIGVSHYFLMNTKWATPIALEMFFITSTCFFLVRGKLSKNPLPFLCAGICLVCAGLSKATGALFVPVASLMLLYAAWEPGFRFESFLFFITGSLIAGLIGLGFFVSQWNEFIFFNEVFASYATKGGLAFMESPRLFLMTFSRDSLTNISNLFLLICPFLALFDMVISHVFKIRRRSKLTPFFLIWFFGGLAVLTLTPVAGAPDRRYVHFVVPMVLLLVHMTLESWSKGRIVESVNRRSTGVNRAVLKRDNFRKLIENGYHIILVVGIFVLYLSKAIYHLNGNWLIAVEHPAPELFFRTETAVALGLIIGLPGLYFGRKAMLSLLVVCFLLVNLTLDGIWYSFATFTLRDTSREIGEILPEKTYISGTLAHWLSIESKARPVWFSERSNEFAKKVNKNFLHFIDQGEGMSEPLAIIQIKSFNLGARLDPWPLAILQSKSCNLGACLDRWIVGSFKADLNQKDFKNRKLTQALDIKIAPFPNTSIYRLTGRLWVDKLPPKHI